MPKGSKQTTEKTEQILQGAMQEFLQHGYADTSMHQIAATASVSKQTLYSYFESKEQLFTAIVERIARQHFQSLLADEPLSTDPAERLRQVAPKMLVPEAIDPIRMNFYRLIVAESGRFPHLAELYVRQFEKTGLEAATNCLQSWTEHQPADPEATAWIITGTLTFYYLVMEVLHGKTVLEMSSDRLIEALIQLLFPKPPFQVASATSAHSTSANAATTPTPASSNPTPSNPTEWIEPTVEPQNQN